MKNMRAVPVPVAVAKDYLGREQWKEYRKAYNAFYGHEEYELSNSIEIIRSALQIIPEKINAYRDLEIKQQQLSSKLRNIEHEEKNSKRISDFRGGWSLD